MEPPPNEGRRNLQIKPLAQKRNLDESKMESDVDIKRLGLDKFVLPFCAPAPKYEDVDQPATKRAMYNIIAESLKSKLPLTKSDDSEIERASSDTHDGEDESQLCLESAANSQMEEEYEELLWNQIDAFTTL